MAQLPSGTVTFLFTDIEGSTQLLHRLGELYATMLADHHRLLRHAWAEHGGVEVDTAGDGFFVAFPTAPAAVTATAAATRALAAHAWPDGAALRVRMGLHTGSPQLVGERYVGLDVHRAARIAAAGHGGQILLSPTTRELVAQNLPDGVSLRDLGTYQLKDFPQPERLYQLVLPGLPDAFPRLKTLDRPPHDLPPRAPGFLGRETEVATLTAALCSAPALVYFDNVERDLPLSRLLNTVTPLGISTLLSSRSEPASPQVRLLRLEVLTPEDGVGVFAERFEARGGKWSSDRDTLITRAIVEALGGLPLAIELAAARAARSHQTPAVLAEELRAPDVLARLSDPLEQSASVRYSLGKTLAALTPSQQAHFAALGLPEGPEWPLPVVERMMTMVRAATPDARTDLEALVAYSLVNFHASEGDSSLRVRLHPLVHELAREEWNQQPEVLQQSVLRGLLDGVHEWVAHYQQDFDQLARDEDLIVATVRAAVARQIDLRVAAETVDLARDYIAARVLAPREEELFLLQLHSAHAIADRAGEVKALRSLARAAFKSMQGAKSAEYSRAALPIARELGDHQAQLALLMTVAEFEAELGLVDEARNLYEEMQAIGQSLGNRVTDPDMLTSLAGAANELGNPAEAAHLSRQALTQVQAVGDTFKESLCLTNLANFEELAGNEGQARQHMEAALAISRRLDVAYSIGMQLDRLGEMAFKVGDVEAAARCFAEALPYLESVDVPVLVEHVRGNMVLVQGEAARQQGEFHEALRLYQEASAALEDGKTESLPAHIGHALTGHPIDYAYALVMRKHREELIQAVAQGAMSAAPQATTLPTKRRRWPWGN